MSEQDLSDKIGLSQQQADAVDGHWTSEQELLERYKEGLSFKSKTGIGRKTASQIKQYIDEHHPDAKVTRRRNDEGIATEFGTDGEATDGKLVWWFVCPRCGQDNNCKGDPQDFAGRPYRCEHCNWVAALEYNEMDDIVEIHNVVTNDE